MSDFSDKDEEMKDQGHNINEEEAQDLQQQNRKSNSSYFKEI